MALCRNAPARIGYFTHISVKYMETFSVWFKAHRKEVSCAIAALVATMLMFVGLFYVPRPMLVDAPSSTKEATVDLHGKANPHLGIAVFDKAGNPLVLVGSGENGEFSISGLPIAEGENIFRLRAVASGWRASFPVIVRIMKDGQAPLLEVSRFDGATVTGSNTVVNGKAEPGSTVTVNGVKTTVNGDGTWSATVALQPGENKLLVVATDAAGNSTTNTETINYAPSAAGSQTGTATAATSTVSYSAGSLPPSATGTVSGAPPASSAAVTAVATSPTATSSAAASPTTATPTAVKPATTTSPTTQTPPQVPVEQKIVNIAANAWVSNPSPNDRANETIYVSVKDNFGRPVAAASVVATVQYKTGAQTYTLSSQGNGTYAVSFKLNDKYASGYRVQISATARYQGFMSTAFTAFTPN